MHYLASSYAVFVDVWLLHHGGRVMQSLLAFVPSKLLRGALAVLLVMLIGHWACGGAFVVPVVPAAVPIPVTVVADTTPLTARIDAMNLSLASLQAKVAALDTGEQEKASKQE